MARTPKQSDAPVFVAAFLAAAVAFNAPAMLRSAENLAYDARVRPLCIAILKPVARASGALRLDSLRAFAESIERKYLE